MVELASVSKPIPTRSPFETLESGPPPPQVTTGSPGSAIDEVSRSARHLLVRGKAGQIRTPFESVIDRDERVRILDTDLSPWRMICALRMRGPSAAGSFGT